MTRFEIADPVDIYEPRREVRALAAEIGFARQECQELAIVVSELVSNILKYGVRGSLSIGPIRDERGAGLAIVARDVGPPFRDLAMAMRDGCDDVGPIDPMCLLTRRGLGAGLGAVSRLTDSFAVEPVEGGKEVRVARYVKRPRRPPGA